MNAAPERVIEVRGLRKSYGDVEAVRGIDLQVDRGEVFALLGLNGAGKTTTTEILEGYRERTGGDAMVLGEDPAHGSRSMMERIGIVLQSTGVDPFLTVRETVELYASYYPSPRDVDEVIDLVGLAEKRRVVQARRVRADAEIFDKFPLRIVPTYPGDERFGSDFFAPFLRSAPPLEKTTLEEIFEGRKSP